MEEDVVLVDEDDRELGTASKLSVHFDGRLHRAFSVFVLDGRQRILLQRRAEGKYHSGGLWSNTCCGHPRPGETVDAAARRRLGEEMGLECDLQRAFSFLYRVELGDGLIEHEFDHVLVGHFDGQPTPNLSEVEAWQWIEPTELRTTLDSQPDRFTAWLPLALEKLRCCMPTDESSPREILLVQRR
jgi:isopentenyl-diphosphate delta-isomerase